MCWIWTVTFTWIRRSSPVSYTHLHVEQVLRRAGRAVSALVITRESVHADEETLGEIMMAMEPRPDVLIAVGTLSLIHI